MKVVVELESIVIPENVYSIGTQAFYYCSSLKTVTLPVALKTIGDSAFYSAYINNVYYAGSQEQWKSISKGSSNTRLTNANITYNYAY